jgi:hypothetical protein
MRKQYIIRWILPIVALLLIATFLVLSPVLSSAHAVGVSTPTTAPTHQQKSPNKLWTW